MRICQINCVYGVGSTGKLTRDIHVNLKANGYESFVIAPLKNQYTSDEGVFTVSNKWLSFLSAFFRRGLGMQFDWACFQTWKILSILRKTKPEVVHLQCINGNNINIYMLLRYLAKCNVKTVYTLHAEFPYTGGCGHAYNCERWKTGCGKCPILREATQSPIIDGTHRTWKNQKKAYSLFRPDLLHFTAVSPWLLARADASPMLKPFKKSVVMNGVDTSVFYYSRSSKKWRTRLGIGEQEKIFLHVTAGFFPNEVDLKGGRFILQIAEKLKFYPVKIVVAANYGTADNLPSNVKYIGRTETQNDLADLYREADITVITSKRETFSMPVAESMCCGTPVVGFRAGGPESIAPSDFSEFVDYGDVDKLCEAIISMIKKDMDKTVVSQCAVSLFSRTAMTESYIKMYLS